MKNTNKYLHIPIWAPGVHIGWNDLIALISEKYSGYLVYRLDSVYSEIELRLYEEKPEYIVSSIDGGWKSKKNGKEPHTLDVHWCRVDIVTFPAPWSSLTKIEKKTNE